MKKINCGRLWIIRDSLLVLDILNFRCLPAGWPLMKGIIGVVWDFEQILVTNIYQEEIKKLLFMNAVQTLED